MKRIFRSLLLLMMVVPLYADSDLGIQFTASFDPASVGRGGRGILLVRGEIPENFHITHPESGIFTVQPEAIEGIHWDKPEFPKGEPDEVGFVYHDRVTIKIPFKVENSAIEGKQKIAISVTYQPCDELHGICYPPFDKSVTAELNIIATGAAVSGGGIADRITNALERGSWLAFLLVFIGGILTSLTPCVYPMIPITLAVIGAQATGNRMKGFVLSLFYVLGIAVTFSTLGLVAARTGALFGTFAQHPIVKVIIAAIFLTMGLSMLGAFVMQMPPAIASRLRGKQRKGFLGAFLTGLVAGLIVSPCISPLLVVILAWVAQSGSMLLGFGLLFSFAVGLGVLFILIGTFSGVLKNLPRTGIWAELIEKGFGLLLIVLAIFFLKPLLPSYVFMGVWALFLMFSGTFLGAFRLIDAESSSRQKTAKAIGLMAVIVSAALAFFATAEYLGFTVFEKAVPVTTERPAESSVWLSSDEQGFKEAKETGKPVLIDFYADWCPACHELDEKTWPDSRVKTALSNYIPVRLDLTRNDASVKAYQKKYSIVGMPTVILLSPKGVEIARFEGFHSPDAVESFLNSHKG